MDSFFTHSGQGHEPYVRHSPPLVFNVERDPGEREPVSARTYDNAKLQEAKMQFVMSAAISCFVHFNWHYTQPLILMSIMQPMQLFDNPAVGIHVRGKSGPGYERPFKSQNAGNPLAQWAEKKKAEAQAAKKKD